MIRNRIQIAAAAMQIKRITIIADIEAVLLPSLSMALSMHQAA